MASEIESLTNFNVYNEGCNRLVFRNPRGNKYYYAIYTDLLNYDIHLEYSTNGTTWSNAAQLIFDEPINYFSFDMKIYDSGSDLKIFLIILNDTTSDLTYIRGSLSDSGTTPVWDTPQDIRTDVAIEITTVKPTCTIAKTDNDRLVVVFPGSCLAR